MDPRIRDHAEVVVDHSTSVEPGDNVLVSGPAEGEDLVVAVMELLGERGANPHVSMGSDRAMRAFLRASDPEEFEPPAHTKALFEETDVLISIRASSNVNERSDVDPRVNAAYSSTRKEVRDVVMDKRWLGTQYPAPGDAQKAEMSTEAYEEFVFDAVLKDWDAQREHQQRMVEILDPASEVRIRSGETTDVRMSIAGNVVQNDYAEHNLPGGEVFTAPVPDSVEGEVLFDKPVYQQGREVTDVRLTFEGGEVVDHAAAKNEAVLTSLLETDEGARRLGELGIGMNRDIDRFTYNMLFDEKMGDTVHMAVGRAYDECVGEGREANGSAVHVDMIVDMSADSVIEVDGEVVQRDGTFTFEDSEDRA
jgi:aminopeptidase